MAKSQLYLMGGKIEKFVRRIMAGEKMSSLEDLQFYENNKKDIEEKLKLITRIQTGHTSVIDIPHQ